MRVRGEYVDYIDWNKDVFIDTHGQLEVMNQVVSRIIPANVSYVHPSQNDGEWLILQFFVKTRSSGESSGE